MSRLCNERPPAGGGDVGTYITAVDGVVGSTVAHCPPQPGIAHAPAVSLIFSTPNRSFSSIWAMLLEVDEPRRPQSHEQVTLLLWTHAKGMPMLKSVCATSRLTRRARHEKITWGAVTYVTAK